MEWEVQIERPEVLPPILRRALDEVERCLDGGAYAMATVASRRGLEALCRDKGVTGSNLEKKLAHLHQDGMIDGRLLDWATHLRHVGNEGAHDLDFEPDRSEAIDAQALLFAVLRYVYVDQARYEEAKRRWEYRQLPAVTVPFGVFNYRNGCQRVYVFSPEDTRSEDGNASVEIGSWTRHRLYAAQLPTVDIASDVWTNLRVTATEWLQVRGFRISDWNELSEKEGNKDCTADAHAPYDFGDEPPF